MADRAERRETQDWQRQRKLASAIEQGAARIVLVRHGETDWNVSKRLQGQWTGDPAPQLTGDGHAQAERLADHLKGAHPSAECIISSDLLRATQTAEYIQKAMPHCSLHTDEGLRERNVGPLHGLLWSEAAEKCPEAFEALTSRDPERRIPGGGESPNDLEERAVAAVRRIGGENAGKTVIIVTHGGFLSLLYKAIMQHAKASGVIRNCAICEVLSDGRTLAALSWNRAAPGEEEGGKDAFGGGLYG